MGPIAQIELSRGERTNSSANCRLGNASGALAKEVQEPLPACRSSFPFPSPATRRRLRDSGVHRQTWDRKSPRAINGEEVRGPDCGVEVNEVLNSTHATCHWVIELPSPDVASVPGAAPKHRR